MERIVPRPAKVEIGFTEDRLTGTGGAALLAAPVRRFGLAERLADAVKVKSRNRGASDAETQLSVIASLAAGNGSLSGLDALREDGRRSRATLWCVCGRRGRASCCRALR